MENKNIKSWGFLNNELVHFEEKQFESKWISQNQDPIFKGMLNNLGIGFITNSYIEVNDIQDKDDEYKKIKKFLNKYINNYIQKNNLEIDDINIEFINYGKTELVYVLTIKNEYRVTLLVKQPIVQLGKVKYEAENLIELKKYDKNIVAPIDYYEYGDCELYVTPYINQARCVASYGNWGMYIPEPYYRFESFTPEQESIVNICMIAKLVSLYNFEKQEGICNCKLGGGDFMLPKGWENEIPTIENTLNNLYLIAAREKIKCTFEDYLKIIRDEFSKTTIYEPQETLIINLRGRVPMKINDIENGIELGKTIIDNNKNVQYSKKL